MGSSSGMMTSNSRKNQTDKVSKALERSRLRRTKKRQSQNSTELKDMIEECSLDGGDNGDNRNGIFRHRN